MLEKIKNGFGLFSKKSYDLYVMYSVIAFIVVMVSALVFGLFLRADRTEQFKAETETKAEETSLLFRNIIETEVGHLEKLSLWFVQIGNPELNFKMDRNQANTVLYENIAAVPDMKTIYMVWEPDMFDGRDSLYANAEYHDSTGRFVPLFVKHSDGIIEHDLVSNYNDNTDVNSYYYFKTKKNVMVLEPVIKRENAQNLLVLPVIYPLHFGTKLLGVIGADYVINSINQSLSAIERSKSSQLLIFTPNGKIAASPEKELLIGRDLQTVFPENPDFYYIKFRRGEDFEQLTENEYIINRTCTVPDIGTHYSICMIVDKDALYHDGNLALMWSLIVGFGLFVLLLLLIFAFRNFYMRQIKLLTEKGENLTNVEKDYIQGGSLYVPEFKRLDGVLYKYYRTFVKIKELNRQIETYQYDNELDTLPQDNQFQKSYNNMLETLRQITVQENERKEKEKAQLWITEGVAAVNDSMRIGSNKVDILSGNILMTLVKYTKAVLGGLYIYSKEEDGEYLNLNAAVAFDKKKAVRIKIEKGVGLVGTCALEKQAIFLDKLPDDYINVFTGLGKSKPRFLAILPMLYDGELIAVAEMAFIRPLNAPEKEFLSVVSSTIASSLVTAKINEQTENLMQQFRSQADALASNEKEMTENINKLKTEQQKSLEREVEMNGLLDAINNSMLSVEFSTAGVLLTANEKYLKTMHYELAEIQGMNIFEFIKGSREELETVMTQVLQGKFYEAETMRKTKNGETKWFLSTYTPYYNFEGTISKILFFATDITANKKVQEDLQGKINDMENRLQRMQSEIAAMRQEKKDKQ
ncbi:MAG: PAS domain S-box protein [Bacteroidales bacterium]|nr:PAS domain S-box protein [Bacteroidales bacterium]